METNSDKKLEEQQKRRLYIKTFGCQMNEYDSEKLERILESGYTRVDSLANADLVLINTCSVREKGEHKLRSLLGECNELRESSPSLMVGVGGCVAQQEGEAIINSNRGVDFVFGTHNLSLVPSLIERRTELGKPQVAVDYRDEWEELPLGFVSKPRVSAFISISRGCNKNCSYCIVPRTRGKEVSRNLDEIEREIKLVCRSGVKEIMLLGQTVNSWGRDLSPRASFTDLLKRVSQIPEVKRIRFTSPHPQEVRADFIQLVTEDPKICRHVHMPLQSGSDAVLMAMNRNYRSSKYIEIIEELKARVSDIAITTDIIVGFPGETDEDFKATLDIMDLVQFDNSYSFMFSPRPGTLAATMPEQLHDEVKYERLQILQERQREITVRRLSSSIGKKAEILVEGHTTSDETCLQGRTSQSITLNLTMPTPALKMGDIVECVVTGCGANSLKGELS